MSKIMCSDEALIGMFSAGMTLAEIGQEAGVTRERIRQIYNRRLSGEFGCLTPRQLQAQATAIRIRAKVASTLPSNPAMKTVLDRVAFLGLPVEAIGVGRERRFRSDRSVLISGRRCTVTYAKRLFSPRSGTIRRYFKFNGYWKWPEFVIAVIGVRILVIPKPWRLFSFYVPEHPGLPVYNHHGPKVDWWAFEDRWDLLGGSFD